MMHNVPFNTECMRQDVICEWQMFENVLSVKVPAPILNVSCVCVCLTLKRVQKSRSSIGLSHNGPFDSCGIKSVCCVCVLCVCTSFPGDLHSKYYDYNRYVSFFFRKKPL